MTELSGRLVGRVAVVTGAGQGAGYGAAIAMAREGGALVLMGRTKTKLDAVATEIDAFGGQSLVFAGDVTHADDIQGVVDAAQSRFGRLDIVVNAAQSPGMRGGKLLDVTPELLKEFWESGYVATLALMRAAYPHMVKAGGGSIINFGSGIQHAPAGFGPYASVKAAIQTLSRAAAMEWGPQNIRVNTVMPFVLSPSLQEDFADKPGALDAIAKHAPLGRVGDPIADIGRAIVFLASDDSAYLTGGVLNLDGGMTEVR
ncbi:SDR family NAD(P)-dependent oxidoreductase [Xanthomonas hortorum]|uniref:SDR family NAD(P)-dependent oxidoreductase n=1 Tax=Xanthomonas hortorum TaxID=56454 RepID=UPI001593D188|nr:SDR family oxidoreductase [Xanthomonas hortorum]NHF65604.1 SDR family oxidoreductase [Xanthomonas hortorum]